MMLLRITILLVYMLIIPVFGINNNTSDGLLVGLLRECKDSPTISCLQRSVYRYFDETFQSKDVDVGGIVKFTKNNLKYQPDEDNETEDFSDNEIRRFGPFEEVSDALREKAIKFFYTHDLELRLPEFLSQGGVLKVSPRALDSIKLDVDPKQENYNGLAPRLFFKKIKKFFSGRLVMALLAILLVIKLIAMKLMFFLPTIMGVAAAKKLLLKVLLFVFPVLSHLFKLCPYYKPTKYHHHHHQISHLHHVGGHPVHEHGPPGGHPIPYLQGAHGVEIDHPPGWPNHHDDELGYYSDGPSFTADFINHRKTYDLGKPPRLVEDPLTYKASVQGQLAVGQHGPEVKSKIKTGPLTPTEIENMVLKAEKEAILKARLQEEQRRVEAENKRLQDSIKNALKLQDKLKIQSLVAKQTNKIAAAYQPNLIPPPVIQPQILHAVPASSYHQQTYVAQPFIQSIPQTQAIYAQHSRSDSTPAPPPAVYQTTTPKFVTTTPGRDPFYSPILDKIDKILNELRFYEEPCRERLICSMYKNPTTFSPHSNLISAELSRDASELQKPTSSNSAVIRFYKYVQAARDGQDKRDCLRLYPSCSILTE